MDTYLTLSEASRFVQVSESYLYELAKTGKIQSAMFSGTVLVSKKDAESLMPIQQRAEYDQSLTEQEIGIVEASDKYGIPHPTISRWVSKGHIRVLRTAGRKKLISEGDIKYFATIYNAHGGSQGRWVFDKLGNPYKKSTK